ncbi:MAG: helix-turn-helix transcriptional regulator [Bacilli bacterium]
MRIKLRAERKSHGWSQQYVAEQLGVTNRAYQQWEYDERTPSLDSANKMEDLFGIPQRELLVRNDTPDSDKTKDDTNGRKSFGINGPRDLQCRQIER